MGVEALKMRLRGVIRRKQIMDDLASFYREQFPDEDDERDTPDEENEER
jgi:hypothetical protein